MEYKKLKPLSCECGSIDTDYRDVSDKEVVKFCKQCKVFKIITKEEYFKEFDEWLEYRLNLLNRMFNQNLN